MRTALLLTIGHCRLVVPGNGSITVDSPESLGHGHHSSLLVVDCLVLEQQYVIALMSAAVTSNLKLRSNLTKLPTAVLAMVLLWHWPSKCFNNHLNSVSEAPQVDCLRPQQFGMRLGEPSLT